MSDNIIIGVKTKEILEKVFSLNISVTVTFLGFLITGFAIYFALFDKDLFYLLFNYKDTDESYSQLHLTNLYYFEPFVFFPLALLMSISGYLVVLCSDPFQSWVYRFQYWPILLEIILTSYFLVLFLCCISFKDFIFNVYTVAGTAASFEEIRRSLKVESDDYDRIIEGLKKMHSK